MSSRFPPSSASDSRFPRDRTPPRSLVRRPSAQINDGPPRTNEPGYRSNDSYGYQSRGREPPRDPPRAPKALIDGPRGGGYVPRGRAGFSGRGDARDRDFRDLREETFPRRGRGHEWSTRDRLDRRPSPVGRDRSRSPLSRDFRDTRTSRDYPSREDLRRDSRESLPPVATDAFLRGRGGFRGRVRGRGDRDHNRGRGLYPEERENFGPRSHSREREWERQSRDERDRDFDSDRYDDDHRREREDQERDDRVRREPPPIRPDSRNSTGGAPTPITSRSTSTTSVRLANIDRFSQNARDSRDSVQETRPKHSGAGADTKSWVVERHDKGDDAMKHRETDNYESRMPSPPPQAPPVPAFGSIPHRAPISNQDTQMKQSLASDQSPPTQPSRIRSLDPSKDAPSAPKAHTLSNAPTAPKAQQTQERWAAKDTLDPVKRVSENVGNRFGAPRTVTGSVNPITKGASFDQVRNISKRFSHSENDASSTQASIPLVHGTSDPLQPSVRKAVEEQGRNGSASNIASTSTPKAPPGDMSNQSSPVKIPTGPRAERAPAPIRQAPPPIARGAPIRGPSMMRGGAWSWVNPDLPKHTPRGPSQPSIMNVVPTKRDSIGEDKSKASLPTAESAESAIAKWRRANAPPSITASQHIHKDAPSQPSPGIMHRVPTTREAIKEEQTDTDESRDHTMATDGDKEYEESDEAAADDAQMDLDEEDFVEAERKFDRDIQALQAKRPPTPRSHPQLLKLLDELDALGSALEERKKMGSADEDGSGLTASLGLPSPKVGDAEEMDFKRETSISPLLTKERVQTPTVDSLPFLNNGPPTPFSEVEDLQEDQSQEDVVESLLERLTKQRNLLLLEDDQTKEAFSRMYKPWRMLIEDIEEERRAEDTLVDPSGVDDMSLAASTPSVVGRRGRVISELAMDEVLRISQETAAKEERARREREAPIYLPPETFNSEREAVVPDMLDKFEAQTYMFTDTNNLVGSELALDALSFTPKPDDFTSAEKETFLYNYLLYPKRFGTIADALEGRDFRDCVQHYYLTKRAVKYKDQEAAFMKTKKGRKIATAMRGQIRPRASGLMSTFDGIMDLEAQNIALTEKGRPRRAAAPIFGDVENETATPAATPARRGAAANKDNPTGALSSEKPAARRTRGPTKEKPGRKPKAQLLAAAPGPSPQKSVPEIVRGASKEPVVPENEPRIDELDGAHVLAGLSTSEPYHTHMYHRQPPPEPWPSRPAPTSMEQMPQHVPHIAQEPPHPPQQKATTAPQTSSYWSVPEQQDFYNLVRHFGSNWQAIASTMKTKTHIMIKNFYSRKIKDGNSGHQLEQEARRADARIANKEDMGPLPAPTPTGEKRRYMYNILKQEQRPLAPSTIENVDVEAGPSKPPSNLKGQNSTRFKQDPPKFTALASAEQGAAQTSEQMMAQGPCSLENRITIPLQTKAQQQVIGPHPGTFVPAERDRAIFSTMETVKENQQREMQARQQLHETREREIQKHPDRESLPHHRHRTSQQENEPPHQTFQQHTPNLVSNSLHTSLLGQPPSTTQSGVANTPEIEFKCDERIRIFIQSQQKQQQQYQEQQQQQQNQAQQQAQQQQQQAKLHAQQQVQQQQAKQHTQQQQQQQQQAKQQVQPQQQRQTVQPNPIQQILQRSAPIDTSTRRVGSGAFGNSANQFTPSQSPASASVNMPPMSPPAEALRPSSVPVHSAAQHPPPPPPPAPGPPKKSSIMDLLNNDSEPQPRKRLSDQRPAAPTPPPQQIPYQTIGQPVQMPMSRREASSESLSHLQQQQRPSFSHQMQPQPQPQPQPVPQLRETRDWASAAQQVGNRPWTEERSSQAHSAISPPSQTSYLPTSSRPAFQSLQRNHVPSPPPFSHSTHSRTSSYTSSVQPAHHQQQPPPPPPQQQTAIPSTPAEPNLRPSPYASLNPHPAPHQVQQQPMRMQQAVLEQQQRQAQRHEQDYRLQQQQQQQQQQEEAIRRQEHERYEMMMRQQQQQEQVRREKDERDRRFGRPGGAGYYSEGGGISGRGLGGGYEERR